MSRQNVGYGRALPSILAYNALLTTLAARVHSCRNGQALLYSTRRLSSLRNKIIMDYSYTMQQTQQSPTFTVQRWDRQINRF